MPRGIQIFMVFVAAIAFLSVGTFLHLTQGIIVPSLDIATSSTEPRTTAAQEVVFNIMQATITARYTISERLTEVNKAVVGTTDQVAGKITLNLADSSQSTIGELRVDARTTTAGDDQREDTVAHLILQTEIDSNPPILFQTTAISGLSGRIAVGDCIRFQVTGDLTIAGMTQSATFTVTASLQAADELTGHAEAIISRADFNLAVPTASNTDHVSDAITLELDFIASAG